MIGRCLYFASVLVLVVNALSADEPQVQPSTPQAGAVTRDILYFNRDYPIFIRVRLEVDGDSFESSWRQYVHSLFDAIDTNKDGRLTGEEIKGKSSSVADATSPDILRLARDPDLWSADRSPFDDAITMDELTAFLIGGKRGPFQRPDRAPAPANSGSVGESLFQLLDIDANRNLTANELSAAMTSLHRRDLDDDGTFSVAELSSVSPGPFLPQAAPARNDNPRPFVTLIPGSVSLDVIRQIERRYTPNPSAASVGNVARRTLSRDLQRSGLNLKDEVFDRYDLDSDGKLDRDELRSLLRNPPPTLELVIRLGEKDEGESVVELIGTEESQSVSVRRSSDGLASIVIGDVQIEIAESAGGPGVAKQYLLRQFALADRNKNNYVEEEEAARSNAFRASFGQFDEDGDGKLYEEELTAVVEGRTKAARSQTRMDVRNRGRDLFEILDVDRNRSLGRRELAQAVKRIELWDTDGDGAISESEIPQLYQISFGPGQPQFRGVQIPGQAARAQDDDNSTKDVAPRWFKKLDRNEDGELARREFPGTRAEFQKFDQNSDGAIDAAEAEFVK